MEISNLLTENLRDIMAATSEQPTIPWSDLHWAQPIIKSLRALHANSTYADNHQCSFDILTLPLRQIKVSAATIPSNSDFQNGYMTAKALAEFLQDQSKSFPAPQTIANRDVGSRPVRIAASTADPAPVLAVQVVRKRAAQRRREKDHKYWVTNPVTPQSIEWAFQIMSTDHDDGAAAAAFEQRANRIQPPGFFKLFANARVKEKLAAAAQGSATFVLPTKRLQAVAIIVDLLKEWLVRFRNAPPFELVLGHIASTTQSNITQIARACFEIDIGTRKCLKRKQQRSHGAVTAVDGDGPDGEIAYKFNKLQYDVWEQARKRALSTGHDFREAAKAGARAARLLTGVSG